MNYQNVPKKFLVHGHFKKPECLGTDLRYTDCMRSNKRIYRRSFRFSKILPTILLQAPIQPEPLYSKAQVPNFS